GTHLVDRRGHLPAHQRPGQDQGDRPWKPGYRPRRVGQVLLPDDRDRVHADLLAADVVPVGFADGAEGDLADLRAGANHDDPLAVDLEHAGKLADPGHHVDRLQVPPQAVGILDAVQLPVDRAALAAVDDLDPVDI